MGKKAGLFTFVAGLAAGAAALFLSDEDNRKKAEAKLSEAATGAKKFKKEFDKDPEGAVLKVAESAEKKAKAALRKATASQSKSAAKSKSKKN